LYDLESDPGEFHDVAGRHPKVVKELSAKMLVLFRTTHPEAGHEPAKLGEADALDWYLRPRDARP
jgi:hypothetical protein